MVSVRTMGHSLWLCVRRGLGLLKRGPRHPHLVMSRTRLGEAHGPAAYILKRSPQETGIPTSLSPEYMFPLYPPIKSDRPEWLDDEVLAFSSFALGDSCFLLRIDLHGAREHGETKREPILRSASTWPCAVPQVLLSLYGFPDHLVFTYGLKENEHLGAQAEINPGLGSHGILHDYSLVC